MARTITNPAAELLTLAGSHLVALKIIRLLTEHPERHPLSLEQTVEQIGEVATAALEHRNPCLSEETLALLAHASRGEEPLLREEQSTFLHQALQPTRAALQAVSAFLPGEFAWGCFLVARDAGATDQTLRFATTSEAKALAQALGLAANRNGALFSPRRARKLIALISDLSPRERQSHVDVANARLGTLREQSTHGTGEHQEGGGSHA